MKPSDLELASTLNDVLTELHSYWNVPHDCPTMKRLHLIQNALFDRTRPSHGEIDEVLSMIRSRRSKPISDQD